MNLLEIHKQAADSLERAEKHIRLAKDALAGVCNTNNDITVFKLFREALLEARAAEDMAREARSTILLEMFK